MGWGYTIFAKRFGNGKTEENFNIPDSYKVGVVKQLTTNEYVVEYYIKTSKSVYFKD